MKKTTRTKRIPDHMAPRKGEIRLFENRFLERLSKISPVTVLAVYLPMLVEGSRAHGYTGEHRDGEVTPVPFPALIGQDP